MSRTKVLIMGAAGRDFHNFNTVFRDCQQYQVIGFTATQIPNIEGRKYPAELAGSLYPEGIAIHPEEELEELIKKHDIDEVVFSYSDVSHEYVMHLASRVTAQGANFRLLGSKQTALKSSKPVVSVCAVRTGCGKSPTSRRVVKLLIEAGLRVVAIRHPMPYGDLTKQRVQRFSSLEDLKAHNCTIEEMEEYEPHIINGGVIYAGVDYEAILRQAEAEADVILWDGGNNDLPFYVSDLEIVIADPHRPGHELTYYPGEANLRRADVIILNKIDSADGAAITTVRHNIRSVNATATVIDAAMPLLVEDYTAIRNSRVLVVEDGPTLTHGNMKYGAGILAAEKYGAREIIDPRSYTIGSIAETFQQYPLIGPLLPAMGYGAKQMRDLADTINRIECDLVLIATPIDLRRVIDIKHPSCRVGYELQEIGHPNMHDVLKPIIERAKGR
ncbi:MAG: cyclic 2,3-diphosphoglycerate synthase [Acidobacteriota bacterium]